jgi:glyoxylase-like metal-dependent hydrolase (beta-lactamase superfamily II)/rhodanese-related sulfurtransferase
MPREFPDIETSVPEISPAEFKRRLDDGEQLTLLDTRKRSDFEAWQISHPNLTVTNVPFSEFLDDSGTEEAEDIPDGVPHGPLITCCAKGRSSKYVAEYLAREGWDIRPLEDGMRGWANLLETRHIESGSAAVVLQFHRPSSGCLSHLFAADGEAAIVDPLRAFADRYVEIARSRDIELRYALDTHVHADHVSGVRAIAERTDCTRVLPSESTARGLSFDARLVADGDSLPLGGAEIEVRSLPGHTTEMTGYLFDNTLACGDSVFLDGVARPDLEDGDAASEAAGRLWDTLRNLDEIPGETIVAPGHVGPATAPGEDGSFTATLDDLEDRVRAFEESREEFVERATRDLPPQPGNYREIIAINLGQRTADSEDAFELELGPNNCAVSE